MATASGVLVSDVLPPEPASVGRARRFVTEALERSGLAEFVDVAELLVSELATNALLHAGTAIGVRCWMEPTGVRVEVEDGSRLTPAPREYGADAVTGRGLELVAAMATDWGVQPRADGKTLWFRLGSVRSAVQEPEPLPQEVGMIARLLDAPVPLVLATIKYGDAVLRELAFLAFDGQLADVLPGGWHLPQIDVSAILDAAQAAADTGRARSDLDVTVPHGAEVAALERMRLIDLADSLARDGRLLSPPAIPEIGLCRRWMYTEIAGQASGAEPVAWRLPSPLEPTRAPARVPADVLEGLASSTVPTVVADDGNRIIALNAAAADLLGWNEDRLVGLRLTTIIPPELREAHLAGFTRHQLTGEARLLGRTVRVPALRRDGRHIEIDLRIEEMAGIDDRVLFRGELRPATSTSPVDD